MEQAHIAELVKTAKAVISNWELSSLCKRYFIIWFSTFDRSYEHEIKNGF